MTEKSAVSCPGAGQPWAPGTGYAPMCSGCYRTAVQLNVAAPFSSATSRGTWASRVPAHDAPFGEYPFDAATAPVWFDHVVPGEMRTDDLERPRSNRSRADAPSRGFRTFVTLWALTGFLLVLAALAELL